MDKKILRFALLSASLLVGSAAAINANIPAMAQHFDQVPLSMVENVNDGTVIIFDDFRFNKFFNC